MEVEYVCDAEGEAEDYTEYAGPGGRVSLAGRLHSGLHLVHTIDHIYLSISQQDFLIQSTQASRQNKECTH